MIVLGMLYRLQRLFSDARVMSQLKAVLHTYLPFQKIDLVYGDGLAVSVE